MATHHDTMPRSANEERPNTPEQTSKWSRKKKILAGSIAVASVSAVAPVAAFFAMAKGGEPTTPDSSTSGPERPGTQSDYTPSDQVPFLRDSDPAPEVIKDPAVLTAEQVSVWQSGDTQAQTDLASNVIAPRISYAIHELYDAKKQGQTADVSWLTTDPTALNELDQIANDFIDTSNQIDPAEGVEWFGFDVCRSDTQAGLDAMIDICAQENFPEGTKIDFSEGNPIQLVVERETSANDEFADGNAQYHELDNSTVRLKGDTLVIEPIAN